MVWEGVPWMVDGGEHSAEVGRLLAYIASQGGEGIVAPTDCAVIPSAIPDGNVHVTTGGVVALNRFPGGNTQSYVMRNIGDAVIAMTPQGSGGERFDLVCVIVEDPEYPGQPDPVDEATGPYVRLKVYEDVDEATKFLWEVDPDQTGYALARVKFDASDGTVMAADITDLREMVAPRRHEFLRVVNGEGAPLTPLPAGSTLTDPAPPNAPFDVLFPHWATHMIVECDWAGVQAQDTSVGGTGGATGFVRIYIPDTEQLSPYTEWSVDSVGASRVQTITAFAGGTFEIAEEFRGLVHSIVPVCYEDTSAGMDTGTDRYTTIRSRVTFYEAPVV